MGSVATGRIYIIVRRMIGSWMIDSVMRDTRSIATRLKRAQRINRSFEPLDTPAVALYIQYPTNWFL